MEEIRLLKKQRRVGKDLAEKYRMIVPDRDKLHMVLSSSLCLIFNYVWAVHKLKEELVEGVMDPKVQRDLPGAGQHHAEALQKRRLRDLKPSGLMNTQSLHFSLTPRKPESGNRCLRY
ncbi:hypothetical protein llap_7917 [Limosa lapponica baueri]|uniref:Uncharacterized protein n=1 Tax=Limosa lapponica baueri TaxID=1758121 RepID=A0A2I0U6V8_LIMLA|nr:hypothetical protein llap_7917 [Limosa lapponica baueri]